MRPEDFDINKIIETLQGSCDTIQSALDYHYPEMIEMDMVREDHDELSSHIFLCEQCGWWLEQCDSGEDEDGCYGDICSDCIDSQQ